jgi:hypothetical protein
MTVPMTDQLTPEQTLEEWERRRRTCPPWCTVTEEEHAAERHNNDDGSACHHAVDTRIRGRLRELTVTFSSMTDAHGREKEPAILYIDDQEFTMAEAEQIAEAIRSALATYRMAGGAAA